MFLWFYPMSFILTFEVSVYPLLTQLTCHDWISFLPLSLDSIPTVSRTYRSSTLQDPRFPSDSSEGFSTWVTGSSSLSCTYLSSERTFVHLILCLCQCSVIFPMSTIFLLTVAGRWELNFSCLKSHTWVDIREFASPWL